MTESTEMSTREIARARADQTLDEGYPFPADHPWWRAQARLHSLDVIALLDEIERLKEKP